MLVKKDTVVTTNDKKADEINGMVRVEEVMAEDVCVEDVKAEDVCVEDVRANDVRADDIRADDVMAESVRAESEIELAWGKNAVSQEEIFGDITDTVSEDCEENIALDECTLKVSILDINVWWLLCS